MGPKRSAGRGRVRHGRGGRAPRSSRGGRHSATLAVASSSSEEGFWQYDFLLRVRGQGATRILLPPAFSSVASKRGLDGLFLRLHGCFRSPSFVELEVDDSRLIFLGSVGVRFLGA